MAASTGGSHDPAVTDPTAVASAISIDKGILALLGGAPAGSALTGHRSILVDPSGRATPTLADLMTVLTNIDANLQLITIIIQDTIGAK